jgi:molybdate transport system regulatory protein
MNRLPGEVLRFQAAGSLALIEVAVADRRFTASLLTHPDQADKWQAGVRVTLLFKDSEVALAKNLSGLISMRNRIPATITSIERGTLLTRIGLDFAGHALDSVITTGSCEAMALAVGDRVEGLVKSNEMTLIPEGADES